MPVLERWTPFRDLELMEQRMRRLFPLPPFAAPIAPAADIFETKDEFVFELEVPGYEEKELDVELSDHLLTITGTRQVEKESTAKTVRLHERLEPSFERSFQLPRDTDGEHLKATYGRGILTLHVPKTAESKPLKVPIGEA